MTAGGPICNRRLSEITRPHGTIYLRRLHLRRELESFWLDHDVEDPFALADILSPYPAEAMQAYEVSSLVNRPSNEGPEVAIPVGQESPPSGTGQAQLVMFQHWSEETFN